MGGLKELMRGRVSISEQGALVIREAQRSELAMVVRDEIRPHRELQMAQAVKIDALFTMLEQIASAVMCRTVGGTSRIKKVDVGSLQGADREHEEMRISVAHAMMDYIRVVTGRSEVDMKTFGSYYGSFYGQMNREIGYTPTCDTYFGYLGSASKVNTVIKDGHGKSLLRIIHRETEAAKSRKQPVAKRKQKKQHETVMAAARKRGRPKKIVL